MRIIKKTLKNGLHIILIPIAKSNEISVNFIVRVGANNEDPNILGISHFLEHVMQGKLTRDGRKISDELNDLNVISNAVTNDEHTWYFTKGRIEYADQLINLTIQKLKNPDLNPQVVESERYNVWAEFRQDLDQDRKLASYFFREKFARANGGVCEIDAIGTVKNIKSITFEQLQTHHDKYYQPTNIVVVIAGKFDPQKVFAKLKDELEDVKPRTDAPIVNDQVEQRNKILATLRTQESAQVYIRYSKYHKTVSNVFMVFPIIDETIKFSMQKVVSYWLENKILDVLKTPKNIQQYPLYSFYFYLIPLCLVDTITLSLRCDAESMMPILATIVTIIKRVSRNISNDDLLKIRERIERHNKVLKDISDTDTQPKLISIAHFFAIKTSRDRKSKLNYDDYLFNKFNSEQIDLKLITKKNIQDILSKIFDFRKLNVFIYGGVADRDFSLFDV